MVDKIENNSFDLNFREVGMLGVLVSKDTPPDIELLNRMRMIESRILRIEEAFRRTGFDLESIHQVPRILTHSE